MGTFLTFLFIGAVVTVIVFVIAHFATRSTKKPVRQVMSDATRTVGDKYPPGTYGGQPHKTQPYQPPVMPKSVVTSQPVSRPKPPAPKPVSKPTPKRSSGSSGSSSRRSSGGYDSGSSWIATSSSYDSGSSSSSSSSDSGSSGGGGGGGCD